MTRRRDVQTDPQTSPRVVVGVDGSAGSAHALRFAIDEARRRAARLVVVHVVHWDSFGFGLIRPETDQLVTWGEEVVARMLHEVQAGDGDPPIERVVVEGHPASTLSRQAQGASVLVIGTRGRGAVQNLLLGSVSLHCLMHPTCPTVVVPPAPNPA